MHRTRASNRRRHDTEIKAGPASTRTDYFRRPRPLVQRITRRADGSGTADNTLAYFDEHLFFLTPLRPKRTGLLSVVFVSPMGLADHGPSIKVNNIYGEKASPEDWFIITIEDDPQVIGESAGLLACDVQKARKWVQVNKNELLKIWEDDVDVFDADLQQV